METLVGVGFLATPVALLVALVGWRDRQHRRRDAEVRRQVALTDALHARLGAAVAPVVRRLGGRWQIAVAVPFEQPLVVGRVLATVDEMFGRVAYEIVLSRQAAPAPPSRLARRWAVGQESLSWT